MNEKKENVNLVDYNLKPCPHFNEIDSRLGKTNGVNIPAIGGSNLALKNYAYFFSGVPFPCRTILKGKASWASRERRAMTPKAFVPIRQYS